MKWEPWAVGGTILLALCLTLWFTSAHIQRLKDVAEFAGASKETTATVHPVVIPAQTVSGTAPGAHSRSGEREHPRSKVPFHIPDSSGNRERDSLWKVIDTMTVALCDLMQPSKLLIDTTRFSLRVVFDPGQIPENRWTWELFLKQFTQSDTSYAITRNLVTQTKDWAWISSAAIVGILIGCLLMIWGRAS